MDRIAKELGAERKGKVAASGGYFGAMQLVADIEARLLVPAGGGRRTDPQWTERRLIPVAVRTLERLEKLTTRVREHAWCEYRTHATRCAAARKDNRTTEPRRRGKT